MKRENDELKCKSCGGDLIYDEVNECVKCFSCNNKVIVSDEVLDVLKTKKKEVKIAEILSQEVVIANKNKAKEAKLSEHVKTAKRKAKTILALDFILIGSAFFNLLSVIFNSYYRGYISKEGMKFSAWIYEFLFLVVVVWVSVCARKMKFLNFFINFYVKLLFIILVWFLNFTSLMLFVL